MADNIHLEIVTPKQVAYSKAVDSVVISGIEGDMEIFNDQMDGYKYIVPFYILFIIYGSYYNSLIKEKDNNNFTFFKEVMNNICHLS